MYVEQTQNGVQEQGQRSVSLYAWLSLFLLLTLFVLSFVNQQIIALMVAPIKASLGVSDMQIALVHGLAYAMFYALAGLPLGWAVDHGQPKIIMMIGILVMSVSTISCGFTNSFEWLFIGRLGVGIGAAAIIPAAFAIIASVFPRNRMSLPSSIFMAGSLIGGGLAFAIGGSIVSFAGHSHGVTLPLLGTLDSWRATFVLVGLPGIGFAAASALLPTRTRLHRPINRAQNKPDVAISFGMFLQANRTFLVCHLSAFALLGCAAFGGQAWGPTHMARHFGTPPGIIGLSFALAIGGFGTTGTFLAAALVQRLYQRGQRDAHDRFHVWTTVIGAPFAAGAFLVGSPLVFTAMLCVTYFIFFSFAGTATAALQLISPPTMRGRIAALYGIALTLGGGAGGPLMIALVSQYVLHDSSAVGMASAISILICATGATLLLTFARQPLIAAQDRLETSVAAGS